MAKTEDCACDPIKKSKTLQDKLNNKCFLLQYKVPELPLPCDKTNCSNPPKPPCPPVKDKCCFPCDRPVVKTCAEQRADKKRKKPAVFKPDQPVLICECRPQKEMVKRTTRKDLKNYKEPTCPPCPPKYVLKKCGCKKWDEKKTDDNAGKKNCADVFAPCNAWSVYKDCDCKKF